MQSLYIQEKITIRDENCINIYFNQISKYKPLSPNEEIELFYRAKSGDNSAIEKIIYSNLRFVVSVAKQYQRQGLSLADLISEGNLGLLIAIKKFEPSKGFKFISYAVWWIRQSIINAINNYYNIIPFPANKINLSLKIYRVYIQLYQKLEREPTIEELSKETKLDPKNIYNFFYYITRHFYLSDPIDNEEEKTYLDVIPAENSENFKIFINHTKDIILLLLKKLSEKEAEVLKLYYGINCNYPHTLLEISEKLNISKERVRQLKDNALKKLSAIVKQKKLKNFFYN